MTFSFKHALAIFIICCLLSGNVANAALINGDFSTNNVPAGTHQYANTLTPVTGGTTATGWNFVGYAGISNKSTTFSTYNTDQTFAFIQYYNNNLPQISQTFTETANSLMNISFDMYS